MARTPKKGLIIVFRKESLDDFQEIVRRAYKLDPSVFILGFPERIDPNKIPKGFFDLPHLVIYLVNPPPVEFIHTSPMLEVRELGKLGEYEHFKEHHLSCLPIERFEWGMRLDPSVFGDWVVLKPETMTSTGADVNMVKTALIPTLGPEHFSKSHLIHQDKFLVQKFIRCGERPTHYRVLVFLGEILYSAKSVQHFAYPSVDMNLEEQLTTSIASNLTNHRSVDLVADKEVNEFALKVASTFTVNNPLLGIDVIRDDITGHLYVLEVNSGGNTWAFSSKIARLFRDAIGGRKSMVLQYNAWDRAAAALLKKVHEIAR